MGPGDDPMRLPSELNLLVVTIDTLRADRLGCYGYHQARTPVIDSVAASGVRFDNAYSHQPVTLPSHTTLFTGTHPAYHGISDNGIFALPDEAVTMAEVLKGAGFSTGAVIGAFVLDSQFGLDQGFDTYDDSFSTGWKKDPGGFEERTATGVSDRALEWIGENAGTRWFLWVHYFDPHGYYQPPPAYQWAGGDPYDGEVAYVDFELGRILGDLQTRGLRERTLVIIAADHGESHGEHGELSHGLFLYEASMRVPLIASLPGAIPAGRVASQTVSLMDVAPTVLSALGMPPLKQVQGRDLMPLLFSDPEEWEARPVIMETMVPWNLYGWSPSRAIVHERFKYIESPQPELYDLEADPRELTNLYDEDRDRAEVMAKRLEAIRTGYGESSLEDKSGVTMDDATRDRLASLGYIFCGPSSRKPAPNAPDVKDMIALTQMTRRASELRDEGNEEEAISILENVLQKSPDSRKVVYTLGTWYAQKKDFQNAEKLFKRLVQLEPNDAGAYYDLGLLYASSSRLKEATTMAETVLSKRPRSATAHGLFGIIRLKESDYEGALEYLDKAIEYDPNYAEAMYNRSVAYYFLGEHDKALQDLKNASRLEPANKTYAQGVAQLEKQMKAK